MKCMCELIELHVCISSNYYCAFSSSDGATFLFMSKINFPLRPGVQMYL